MLSLPAALRDAFKEPLGPVHTDTTALLAAAERARTRHGGGDDRTHGGGDDGTELDPGDGTAEPFVVAVGDVVAYHLLEAGHVPRVAVVDGRTERETVDDRIRETVLDPSVGTVRHVENPPAELSRELLAALREAVDADGPVTVHVDGEEDLATLPAILVAPPGASVVYGQPGEGMVHVAVTPATRTEARTLFSRLDGDTDAALALLGA